jgi:hypothetical protein
LLWDLFLRVLLINKFSLCARVRGCWLLLAAQTGTRGQCARCNQRQRETRRREHDTDA